MKDNQSEHNMGEQIMGALSDALQSGDFNDLNRLVSQSVTNALNEVGKHITFMDSGEEQGGTSRSSPHDGSGQAGPGKEDVSRRQAQKQAQRQAQEQARQRAWEREQERARRQEQAQRRAWEQAQKQAQRQAQEQAQRQRRPQMYRETNPPRQDDAFRSMPQAAGYLQAPAALPYKFKKVGNVSNVLYQVFGGIGLGVTALMIFFSFTLLLTNSRPNTAVWIINLLFLALFAGMIRLGIGQRRRLKLAERYARLCGRNLYGEIEHLARSTGRKTRRVIKDLQKMIRLGIFPEGHLDEQRTCFMLDDGIYRQYLETEKNRRLREEADSLRLRDEKTAPKPRDEEGRPDITKSKSGQEPISPDQESELNAMVAEGMECVRKLRLLNDKIPGEVISAKLFRLENLLKDLFDSVREHPGQMHRMHKLMNYYLPTTLKLVEAYEEFDRVSAPGDDIIAAKAEIENTLDTINQAFTELLNNLFQDAVLDATTDAQVLKTMLAREGLMNEMDFSAAK